MNLHEQNYARAAVNGPAGVDLRSVLCVYANADAQQFLQKALAEFRVVIAATALEALRALNSGVFDLYLLDYWLPDWSGISLCRDIRKVDPRGPVCFYTAAEGPTHRQRALNAGASLYLQAPMVAAVLSRKITSLVHAAHEQSLRAMPGAERVIHTELKRRAASVRASAPDAMNRAASAIERTAKVKTWEAFIEGGGTRAQFERWWPQQFAGAWETHTKDNVTPHSQPSPPGQQPNVQAPTGPPPSPSSEPGQGTQPPPGGTPAASPGAAPK